MKGLMQLRSSADNLKISTGYPFTTRSRSEYSHVCFANCQEICFVIQLHFLFIFSSFFSVFIEHELDISLLRVIKLRRTFRPWEVTGCPVAKHINNPELSEQSGVVGPAGEAVGSGGLLGEDRRLCHGNQLNQQARQMERRRRKRMKNTIVNNQSVYQV